MRRFAIALLFLLLALLPTVTLANPTAELSAAGPQPEGEAPNPAPAPNAIGSWVSNSPRFGVAESFRNEAATNQLGLKWDRIVVSWTGVQPNGPADWRADQYFSPQALQKSLNRGMDVVALLQFTPTWAARNPEDGQRSVPKNLALPYDNRDNYWAQFAGRAAAHYKGRIDNWIIWNEPEFKPGDKGAGQSATWYGTDEEYYLLLKRSYQAIKAANPNANVSFGATSYWVDINNGREPFFKRLLEIMARDPEARANNYFFDAVSFNVYRAPDDLYRIYFEMKEAMRAKGINKPIWLSETNAMPWDDPTTPKPQDGQRVTLHVQADYALQGLAMAAAAGYERIGWYRISDGGVWQEQEVWGLTRDDGYPRPVFQAFKTGVQHFSGANRVIFMPLERADQPFGTPWPQDPKSYYPNWQVYQVIFDHPDGRRVTALWNATDSPLRVRIPKLGSAGTLVDKFGEERPLADNSGWYVLDLAPGTVHGPFDPDGYHYVGGTPVLVIDRGVPANSPAQEPRLGDPGSVEPGIELTLDPAAQKFVGGENTRFTMRVRGIEGFGDEVQLSTGSVPPGLRVDMPPSARPGDRVTIAVYSEFSVEPNLYVLPITGRSGDLSASVNMVLEVPAR